MNTEETVIAFVEWLLEDTLETDGINVNTHRIYIEDGEEYSIPQLYKIWKQKQP